MKGCLTLLIALIILAALMLPAITGFNQKSKQLITAASPTPTPRDLETNSSPKPAPTPSFPDPKYWPSKCHLLKATSMKAAQGTVTLPPNTEIKATLSGDHEFIFAQIDDPSLSGVVPLKNTDFILIAQGVEAAEKLERLKQEQLVEAQKKAEQQRIRMEDAAYGNEPLFVETGLFGTQIPECLKSALKRSAKDPSSLKIRELNGIEKDDHGGIKCWKMQLTIASKNSFGGYSTAVVTAWVRNEQLIDIQIHQ